LVDVIDMDNSRTGSGASLADANRRRSGRLRLDVRGNVVAEGGNRSVVEVRIVELSVNGVGMVADAELIVGEMYQVNAFDSLVPVGMRMKVISMRGRAGGGFDVGGEVA
jgi:hypothetical protein